MLIQLYKKSNQQQISNLKYLLEKKGFSFFLFRNTTDHDTYIEALILPKNIELQSNGHNSACLKKYKLDNLLYNELRSNKIIKNILPVHSNYPILARPENINENYKFYYQDIEFSQESFNIFAGLNTVDNLQNVEKVFKKLKDLNLTCTRMGAYKPRTNPYSFQGLKEKCLPYVFELAGKYNIKVIAMEVMSEQDLEEINSCMEKLGNPTGIMLQIGTRNAQNFDLLKIVGRQNKYPVLFKRGFGITLNESLNAAEYIASSGNNNIIFCLRGMKSLFSETHRNFVDFSLIPSIKKQTKMPVCIDPSHSVGNLQTDQNGIADLMHINAQGVVAGANMLLIDVHPNPDKAVIDSKQTLDLKQLELLVEDSIMVRNCYLKRKQLLSNKEKISTKEESNIFS